MKNEIIAVIFGMSTLFVSGCTSLPVGSAPDNNPPKMVASEAARGWSNGDIVNVLWDRSTAFGPVPANMQATGENVCRLAGFSRVIGFHPTALDLNGQAVRGGGYLCTGSRNQ